MGLCEYIGFVGRRFVLVLVPCDLDFERGHVQYLVHQDLKQCVLLCGVVDALAWDY